MRPRRRRILGLRRAAAACFLAAAVLAAGAFAAQPVQPPAPFFWPAATPITLPAGAKTVFPATQLYTFSGPMSINALACTSAGNCVGVGDYEDTNGSNEYQAMIVSEAGGVWGAAHELQLPKHVTPPGAEVAGLDSVACTSPGNCVAVGYYTAGSVTAYESMAVVESAGAWGQAQPITPPVASAASTLSGVSCVSDGNCVAVGGYTGALGTPADYDGYDGRAMAVAMIGGAWGAATDVKLPANASTTSGQLANLTSVSCNSDAVRRAGISYRAGNCVAVGNYLDDSSAPGNELTMAASEAGGVWSQATPISQPSGTSVPQGRFLQEAGHQSVSCTSIGNCVAVSVFADAASPMVGMFATETAGSWGPGTELGPATAVDGSPAIVDPEGVSCPSAGDCVVVGAFSDSSGDDERAMVANEVNGAWGAAFGLQPAPQTPPGGPAPATGGPGAYAPGAFLYGVACTSPTSCVAGGGDTDGENDYRATVVSSVQPPTIATATLPPAVVGSPYSAQLKATGGGSDLAWSLQSGSLPAGLKLNSASGLISGTPTAPGTSHFTVELTEPDLSPSAPRSPAPSTAALTIAVSAKPSSGGGGGSSGGGGAQPATATIAAVRVNGSKVRVTVACAGAAGERCSGTLALSAVEHLSGHRIIAISAATRRRRTVALGHTTFSVAGGASAAFTIALNRTAKQLLSRHHRFRAELVLSAAGRSHATATTTVSLAGGA